MPDQNEKREREAFSAYARGVYENCEIRWRNGVPCAVFGACWSPIRDEWDAWQARAAAAPAQAEAIREAVLEEAADRMERESVDLISPLEAAEKIRALALKRKEDSDE
jgi:hypothetical protein